MVDDNASSSFTGDFSKRVVNIPGPAQPKRLPSNPGDSRLATFVDAVAPMRSCARSESAQNGTDWTDTPECSPRRLD